LPTICPGWLWTAAIFLISASWVARVTGMSHQYLALFFFFFWGRVSLYISGWPHTQLICVITPNWRPKCPSTVKYVDSEKWNYRYKNEWNTGIWLIPVLLLIILQLILVSFFFFFFQTGSHCVVQTGLELL
jgi:hypothetical protein